MPIVKIKDKRAAYTAVERGYRLGFGPRRLAPLLGVSPSRVRAIAAEMGLTPFRQARRSEPVPEEILAFCSHKPVETAPGVK
jgi:hypothetical protein